MEVDTITVFQHIFVSINEQFNSPIFDKEYSDWGFMGKEVKTAVKETLVV